MSRYETGLDVIGGVSTSDFSPWITSLSKAFGGMTNKEGTKKDDKSTKEAVQKALDEEKAKQQAKTNKLLIYTTIGILGLGSLGLIGWLILKKK